MECTDSLAGCTMFSAPPHCPEIEVKGCAAKTGCATAGLLATVVRRSLVYRYVACPFCRAGHIDTGRWATFNHSRHVCYNCSKTFTSLEPCVGVAVGTVGGMRPDGPLGDEPAVVSVGQMGRNLRGKLKLLPPCAVCHG